MLRASIVVLAFGEEPWLLDSIESVLRSGIDDLEVVVVDNGTAADLTTLTQLDPRVRIVGDGANLGFAGGVNLGVARSDGEVVVLLNSDAELLNGALPGLIAAAAEPHAGIVGALVLLGDDPDRVNSWGNPLHILGLSWAGGFGQPAAAAPASAEVASASGACMAFSRELWDRLGGFSDAYFAYFEDMDLCWRCHQLGLPVTVKADLRVAHHYEFGRSPLKMYLLERNRLLFLLTVHESRTLAAIALPVFAMELALLAAAAGQGWAAEKRKGWAWLWRERAQVRAIRHRVQSVRVVDDGELLRYLTDSFEPGQVPLPAWASPLQAVLRGYWALVRPLIARRTRTSG